MEKIMEMICLHSLTVRLTSQDRVSVRGNLLIITTLNIRMINLKRRSMMKIIMKDIMDSIKRKRRYNIRKLSFRNSST
jgi:hypothetical protein